MSELGKKFKEKRESLGLSLSEASLSTKITPRMIAAIEEGDLKALPALPFAKGFIRAYASYLKLDPEEMVKMFISEKGGPVDPEPLVLETEKKKEEERDSAPAVELNDESSGMKRLFIIGGVAVLIVAIVGVKSLIDKYKREGDLPSSEEVVVSPIEKDGEEAADQADEAKTEEPEAPTETTAASAEEKPETAKTETKAEAPKADVAKTPAPTPVPAVVAPPPATPPPVVAPPVAVKPKPQPAAPQPAAPATPAPASTPAPAPEEVAKKEAAAEKKQMEILFEALDNVQVNVTMGGQNKRISLNAGEVHVLRTSEKVQMDISDGGAVNLVVNGRSRGVPGSLGQKAKVQLP